MADGALSLLAMPAAGLLAGGDVPRRGELVLGGRLLCYRVYECADGFVSMGALEPKFWAAFCRGVGREDLIAHQFDAPGSDAHGEVAAVLSSRTRAEWEAFNAEHDCCLEPVLELDEVVARRAGARARDDRRRAAGHAGAAVRDARRLPPRRPARARRAHREVLGEAGYDEGEMRRAARRRGPAK